MEPDWGGSYLPDDFRFDRPPTRYERISRMDEPWAPSGWIRLRDTVMRVIKTSPWPTPFMPGKTLIEGIKFRRIDY
jgi:hypothetical protein